MSHSPSAPPTLQHRASGVLLHPTSLPGPHGVGDLGPQAHRFVEQLAEWSQTLWQVLPLNPVGFGYSPYQSPSAFAINPMLISPEALVKEGWLEAEVLEALPALPEGTADLEAAEVRKADLLRQASEVFREHASQEARSTYQRWCQENEFWLEDYIAFAVLKELHAGAHWTSWPEGSRHRRISAMRAFRQDHEASLEEQRFIQWQAAHQWETLRAHARKHGVRLIGDLPIFVSDDSADVWAHPDLFELDEAGHPQVVAGVPPDYFSETGQRWGNPLYRWSRMARDGYRWWRERLSLLLTQFDIVRIDHFRGFEAYWEIPASEPTAIQGLWKPGPGSAFFKRIRKELGALPIIAEDLGLITPEVHALRTACGFPGMKVLQFAFSDPQNAYLPHNYEGPDAVVYPGTHDNDTTLGWFRKLDPEQREFLNHYFSRDLQEQSICYEMIRMAWASNACLAISPLQDLLGCDSEARMNTPGTVGGSNWRWRLREGEVAGVQGDWLKHITRIYGRAEVPEQLPETIE